MKVMVTRMYAYDSTDEWVEVRGQAGVEKLKRQLKKEAESNANPELDWVGVAQGWHVEMFENPGYMFRNEA